MKRAKVIIGAAFGDEGKGLMTDYHVRHGNAAETIVVRFNGGAQAGHTVVTPEGLRHVFHHFGSGMLAGARTFLSRYFLVNPVLWRMEAAELERLPGYLRGRLFVDREAPLTTVYDMLLNQFDEVQRGNARHGSCGAGIHQTMVRQECARYRLFAGDLEKPSLLRDRVDSIRKNRRIPEIYKTDEIFERFLGDCAEMAKHINIRDSRFLSVQPNIVFEGAQGLLLDAENKMFFPNVTHSRTGLTNVLPLAADAGIDKLDVTYVVRSYLTRHGAGVLPGEDPSLSYEDNTNTPNEWQGRLRFAPLDPDLISSAIMKDLVATGEGPRKVSAGIALTHMDQCDERIIASDFTVPIRYSSFGPTHTDVKEVP